MNMDLKDEIIQRVVKERLGEPNGIYKRHIHQDLVKEMMEQYHQSKVNNGVLDDVNKRAFNVTYLSNDEIIKGLTVLADNEEEAMHKALLLRGSKDIYSAIEVNVC